MAQTGWHKPNEYKIELAHKHYYFEISENENNSHLVKLTEWSKTNGLSKAPTRTVFIFDNHIRDVVKGLLKVAKRLKLDMTTVVEMIQRDFSNMEEHTKQG